ncbi:MAG: transposase [Burkholderiaceae bacterium]
MLQVVHRAIGRHLRKQSGLRHGQGGAVTLIQRFGSAANLNIHLHCLVLDGVYRCEGEGEPQFVAVAAPTDEELAGLLQTMISRILRMLTRRRVLEQEAGQTWLSDTDSEANEGSAMWPLQAAVTYRIAFGPRAGQKVLTIRGAQPRQYRPGKRLCAEIDGFSLQQGDQAGEQDSGVPSGQGALAGRACSSGCSISRWPIVRTAGRQS